MPQKPIEIFVRIYLHHVSISYGVIVVNVYGLFSYMPCLTIDCDIVRAQPKESCVRDHLSVRQALDLLNSHANPTNVHQHDSMLK